MKFVIQIHVGSQVSSLGAKLRRHKTTILIVLIFILLIAGGIGYLAHRSHERALQTQRQAAYVKDVKAADGALASGNFPQELQLLQVALGEAQTTAEKVAVYQDMADAAANTGELTTAIGYFNQKHQLDPGSAKADAYLLATMYERLGDKTKALEQYRIALAYAKAQPSSDARGGSTGDYSEIENSISMLENN